MSRTKYVKFGARADKNLSDIPNPTYALDNVLDNISVQIDADGNPLRFSSADLLPLVGISQGPLGERLTVSGNSAEFTELSGTTVEGALVGDSSTSVVVQPRVTIQDHISNFKVSLGDPPWIDGGSGPSATIIPTDRLNTNSVNYPEALLNTTLSKQGNTYKVLGIQGLTSYESMQSVLNNVNNDSTHVIRPTGTTTLERINIINGLPFVIAKPGSFDYTACGASTANPPVGTRITPTSSPTISVASGSKIIWSKALGSLVQNRMYTTTRVGSVSANASEWTSIGVEGIPYVGQQFICTKAPADQTTVADAFALEHWSIGDRITHNNPADFSAFIGTGNAYENINLKNQTLAQGYTSTTANPSDLPVSQFYTSKFDSANLAPLITGADFWTNGDIKLNGPLHPDFRTVTGGIVWEGYQSGLFTPNFIINGFFSLEEDVNDDGNWTLLKGVNSFVFETMKEVSWSTVDSVTRVKIYEEEDFKRICAGHKAIIGDLESIVTSVIRSFNATYGKYEYYAILEDDLNITGSGYIELSYDRSEHDLDTGTIFITVPQKGKRRKIRYSVWWYDPDSSQEQLLEYKLFEHDNRASGQGLSYSFFYPDSGATSIYGRYTFPYFLDNHANIENQDSLAKLTVSNTISMLLYTPKQLASDVFRQTDNGNYVGAGHRNITLTKAKLTSAVGTLEVDDATDFDAFTNVSKGDIVTIVPTFDLNNLNWTTVSNELWSFQFEGSVTANKAYVSSAIASASGANIGVGTTLSTQVVSNEGLIGSYKAQRVSDTSLTLSVVNGAEGTFQRSLLDIAEGDLLYYASLSLNGVSSTGVQGRPYVIDTITVSGETATVTVVAHPDQTVNPELTLLVGVAYIYSSKGLVDRTGVQECGGVFGLEAASDMASGASTISVLANSTDRVSINDRVYLDPAIPQATQPGLVGSATLVASKTSNQISLKDESGNVVTTTQAITAGSTIIIVPSTNYSQSNTELRKNREYCVIPLNTAPPFSSYTDGLVTTDDYPHVEFKELSFKKLEYNTNRDFTFTATMVSNWLENHSPSYPTGGMAVGDLIRATGTDDNSVLSVFTDGIIYKVGSLGGGTVKFSILYWNGTTWAVVTGNGVVAGVTFTRLSEAQSLEDIQFVEQTSDSANRGSEDATQAQEPDSYMDISYTPSGGSERTFRILTNSRDVKPR